jgi:transposase-like protein
MTKEPEPRARRQTARRVIDWQRAAELLAGGMTIAAVAAQVGCSPTTLARKRRQEPLFRSGQDRCHQPRSEETDGQLGELCDSLQGTIATEVSHGNLRVIMWLADRLKMVTPLSQSTPEEELRAIVGSLTTEELRDFQALRDDL